MSPLPYYEQAQHHHQPGSFFMHWNWSAFLCGPLWLAYRKCYFYAFLFAVIGATYAKHMQNLYPVVFQYKIIALIPLRVILGLLGTSLYFRKWIKGRQTHHQHTSVISLIFFGLFLALINNPHTLLNPLGLSFNDVRSRFHYEFKSFTPEQDVTPPYEPQPHASPPTPLWEA